MVKMSRFRITPVQIFNGVHAEWVSPLSFFPDGHRLVSQSHEWSDEEDDVVGKTVVWNLDGVVVASRADPGSTGSASLSPDGRWVAVSGFKDFTIHAASDLRLFQRLTVQGREGDEVHFTADGHYLAVAGKTSVDDQVKDRYVAPLVLFRCGTWTPVVLAQEAPSAHVLASTQGGRLACGSWRNWAQFWDLDRRALISEWVANPGDKDGKNQAVVTIALCADGTRLVSSGELPGTFSVWDTMSGRLIHRLGSQLSVKVVISYIDDTFVFSADPHGNIDVWDVGSGQHLARAETGPVEIPAIDIGTGERSMEHLSEAPGVTSLAVSPDGRLIAAGTGSGSVYLYEVVRDS